MPCYFQNMSIAKSTNYKETYDSSLHSESHWPCWLLIPQVSQRTYF